MGCGGSKSTTEAASAPAQARNNPVNTAKDQAGKKLSFAQTYDLKEKLGQGQYAAVHKAIKKSNGQVCAVKCIKKANLTPEDEAALAVEVKAMQMLSHHNNFVKLYDYFDEAAYYYLVLEIIEGGELFDRICEKEKYTEREARALILQLAGAIQAAHKLGVVHRDLKPENVLLKSRTDDTNIKLADLGFAKIIVRPDETMTTPCGTPGYVAPEVISGKPYMSACDIWSLGVIFYILLCGYPPFAAEDNDQRALFEQIKAARYAFDPAEWDAISDGAKDLIRRILVADPKQRFTADQIMAHPWMQQDAALVPDIALGATVTQLKKFNARRKLKQAMNTVRSTVRMNMMMAARLSTSTPSSPATPSNGVKVPVNAIATNTAKGGEARAATRA